MASTPLDRLMRALEVVDDLEAERKIWLDEWKARHAAAKERTRSLRHQIATGQGDLFVPADL